MHCWALRASPTVVFSRFCRTLSASSTSPRSPTFRSREVFAPKIVSSPTSRSPPRLFATNMDSPTQKTVLVPIANGTEEMEAVIIIDVLRRAGANVTVASIEKELAVTCSRGVKLIADRCFEDVKTSDFDVIALPGGAEGADRFRDNASLTALLQKQQSSGRLHAAICASPAVVLEPIGILKNRKATSHPSFVNRLSDPTYSLQERVVVDGTLTTSRGPGTAFEFALSLVKQLYGVEKMEAVAKPMVMYAHDTL